MNQLFSITNTDAGYAITPVNIAQPLPAGYTAMVAVSAYGKEVVYAFNNATLNTDVYQQSDLSGVLAGYAGLGTRAWDLLRFFVLGDKPYIMGYEAKEGYMAFFEVKEDLTLSLPYEFMNKRSWPTQNFTEVMPVVVVGLVYVMGYDAHKGTVAIFSLDVISRSPKKDVPPLNMLNVWYHQWAANWENFAFFTLGQSNFFFKINKGKLNVNIDHILDDPSAGSVEIGSYLEHKMPNAIDVCLSSILPWANGEPYLATLDGKTFTLDVYRIHADCQGWTLLANTQAQAATIAVSYRVNDVTYLMLY